MIYWPRILKWQAGTCVLKMVQFLSAQVFKWEFACNSRLVYHSIFVPAVDTSIRNTSLFHVLLNHRNFFSVGTHLRIKDLVKPRKIWTSQEIQDTRHLVEDNGPDDLQTKITIVFSSHTKTLILWPSIWHDTTKPEAVLVAYHWANFWGAVSFRQVLTNGAASSKACDLELVLTSKLVPCTLPVNSRPFTKRQLISWSQKLFYFH